MLVGRDALLTTGEAALADALAGHGRLLLLSGEAGIGKSTLAHAIAGRAESAGASVRIGACWDTEGLPAFTPWLDALRRPPEPAGQEISERLAGGDELITDAASATRARARLFGDVADALYLLSEAQPQVVVLEDLHWADVPSLELLTALAPHLPSMAVLLVGTYRDDEMPRPNPLTALGGAAERLAVDGLDARAVAEIVATVTGRAPDDEAAVALRQRTGGNPLFVTQMARLLDAGSEGLPSGVQEVLERRLARVSSACADLLGAAAVLGHEFDQAALATLVPGDVTTALDEARAARLVEPCDGDVARWRFVHALVQATRYAALSTTEREIWHRAAIEALRSRAGTTAAVLAHHAGRARFDPGDPMAAELHVAAGQEALDRLAWGDATTAFERALLAAPEGAPAEPARAEAWLGIGAARLRQGRPDAREAFDRAAAIAKTADRSDLLARAALGFAVGLGAFEVRLLDHRQIEVLEEAAAALSDDHPLLPLVLARLSVALAFVGSDDRRAELATRAVDLARDLGEPVTLGHALAARCDAFASPDHLANRLAESEEIIVLALRSGDLPLELLGRRIRVVALLESLQFAEIDREIALYQRAADTLGDPLYAWYGSLWSAVRAWGRGDLAEADRLIEDAVATGARGGSENSSLLGHVFWWVSALERRDVAAAERHMEGMLAMVANTLAEYFTLSFAYLDARLGRLEDARGHLARTSPTAIESLPRDSEWMSWVTQLILVSALVDDPAMCAIGRLALEPLTGIGTVEGIGAFLYGSSDRHLALAAAVAGDVEATRHHVDEALRLVRDGGALLVAVNALDGAWALRRLGTIEDAERAGALAGEAHAVFDRLGLDALAGEAAAFESASPSAPVAASTSTRESAGATLLRQGDTWAVTWLDTTVHVKHAKGVADLALLLERPGREVHVRELEGVAAVAAHSSDQTVLDDTAVQQYRQRLVDLEEDLDEADRHGDSERATRLVVERDALVDELTKAFGLTRQGRRLGSDPDERLRKAVSARIKASIDRLDGLDPALGRHLRASVQTGFWCRYAPERPVTWTVRR